MSQWEGVQQVEVSFWKDAATAFDWATGTVFQVPPPPLQTAPFWAPANASLRGHVQQKRWCWRLFELLRLAIRAAYRGFPQHIKMLKARPEGLGPLAEWLRGCGAVLSEDGGRGPELFHLEFSNHRRIRAGF